MTDIRKRMIINSCASAHLPGHYQVCVTYYRRMTKSIQNRGLALTCNCPVLYFVLRLSAQFERNEQHRFPFFLAVLVTFFPTAKLPNLLSTLFRQNYFERTLAHTHCPVPGAAVVRTAPGSSSAVRAAGSRSTTARHPGPGDAPVRATHRGGQAAAATSTGKFGVLGAPVRRRGRGQYEQRRRSRRRGWRDQRKQQRRRQPAHARAAGGCGQSSAAGLLVPGGPRRGVHRRSGNRHRWTLLKVAAAAGAAFRRVRRLTTVILKFWVANEVGKG